MSPSWTPRLPISWIAGTAAPSQEEQRAVRLQVVEHTSETGPALVSPATAKQLGLAPGSRGFLCLAEGSDCLLPVVAAADVADGQIAVSPVQQFNLHLGAGMCEDFRVFVPPAGEPFELVDLQTEVTLLGSATQGEPVQVDGLQVAQELQRRYLGRVLALGEACVLSLPESVGTGAASGSKLLLRVTATNTLDAEARDEQLGYHCYRGLLTPDTEIFLHTPEQLAAWQQQQQQSNLLSQQQEEQEQRQRQRQLGQAGAADSSPAAADSITARSSWGCEDGGEAAPSLPQSIAAARGSVVLLNTRQRPASGPSRSSVSVFTSDGEWFPVKRKLLRPCISLTKAVRSEEGDEGAPPEVTVDVDTLTFDRVLIFLEALALGREPPAFGLHLCPQLLAAAQHLGLRPLEEYCRERLGESQTRLRFYSFEEVKALNAAGGCWLILDGMVLDVTRWLPEHPGGSRIIPAQSLNMDCSRFFELYHASKESFLYIAQFYMGEILPEDRGLVPAPSVPPSEEFMAQLREYTSWRLQAPEAATHLGAKKGGAGHGAVQGPAR